MVSKLGGRVYQLQTSGANEKGSLTLVSRCEHDLGAERLEQHPSLHRHGRRHGQNQLVALGGSHHRKTNT